MPRRAFCLLLIGWTLALGNRALGNRPALAASPGTAGASKGSIGEGFKSSIKRLTDLFTPKTPVTPADDPTSLATEAKPSPELYVSMGLLMEQQGRAAEAERRYQQALKLNPKHLGAMVALARLKDRQDEFQEAVRLYQQAAQAHPDQAAVLNDLGLCYARRKRLSEAAAQLERAVQLSPKEARYRNNLATVLVEMGDVDRAFAHLAAVHGEAVAYYNLGYLMHKKGEPKAAAVLFGKALQVDPSLSEARIWLERLGGVPAALAPTAGEGWTVLSGRATAAGAPPIAPVRRLPAQAEVRQLPPVPQGPLVPPQGAGDLPGTGSAVASDTLEDAPLPPSQPPVAGETPPAQKGGAATLPGLPVEPIGPPAPPAAETAPLPPGPSSPSAVQPLPPIDQVLSEP